jgi:hypothetical protein
VWQRQGMTAQEMTLPLGKLLKFSFHFIVFNSIIFFVDVVIPTSSADKQNIVLKAGQKVMVLKSPKGIYMQLENGKIIAIRTSMKMNSGGSAAAGHRPPGSVGLEKPPTFASMQESAQTNNMPANLRNQALLTKNPRFNFPGSSSNQAPVNDDDVINISNDEDEDEEPESKETKQNSEQLARKSPVAIIQSVERIDAPLASLLEEKPSTNVEAPPIVQPLPPSSSSSASSVAADSTYKEKVFKPNLVGRRPKVAAPSSTEPKAITSPNFGNYPGGYSGNANFKSSTNAANDFPPTLPAYNSYQPNSYQAGSSRYYGNNDYNYNSNYPPNNYPPKRSNPQFHGGRKFDKFPYNKHDSYSSRDGPEFRKRWGANEKNTDWGSRPRKNSGKPYGKDNNPKKGGNFGDKINKKEDFTKDSWI